MFQSNVWYGRKCITYLCRVDSYDAFVKAVRSVDWGRVSGRVEFIPPVRICFCGDLVQEYTDEVRYYGYVDVVEIAHSPGRVFPGCSLVEVCGKVSYIPSDATMFASMLNRMDASWVSCPDAYSAVLDYIKSNGTVVYDDSKVRIYDCDPFVAIVGGVQSEVCSPTYIVWSPGRDYGSVEVCTPKEMSVLCRSLGGLVR